MQPWAPTKHDTLVNPEGTREYGPDGYLIRSHPEDGTMFSFRVDVVVSLFLNRR